MSYGKEIKKLAYRQSESTTNSFKNASVLIAFWSNWSDNKEKLQDELWPWLVLTHIEQNSLYPDRKCIVRLLDIFGSKF